MNKKPKILLEVAALSMRLSAKYLQPHSSKYSPQKFTQSQLLTCLILRAYLKTTYRGLIEFLEASSELRRVLQLKRLPHYSTLKYFADRSNVAEISNLLMAEIIRQFEPATTEAAIDSTGMETSAASAHFQSRSGKSRQKYVKISVCVLVGSLLPAGVVASWGPSNDKQQVQALIERSAESVTPKRLFADAGYDAEWVHELCRDHWGTESVIKPAVHRADGGINGKYRSRMTAETLKKKKYGRRWSVESFMSALKRTTGSMLSARSERALFTEATLRVLAYALRR